MRICIISDLHANIEALSALPHDYDELWVLGDLVNYGPDPVATIDFVRSHASTVIRGNHDHSVGFGSDCRCSPRFREMAEGTRDYTVSVLSAADKQYLRDLPTCACRQVKDDVFFLCHATPSDFLYEYRPPDSPLWDRAEAARTLS
jgi:predicted phosphodiesterase